MALPVYSVDTEEEARQIITTVSQLQYEPHPERPDESWFKLTWPDRFIDYRDLDAVTEKLESVHRRNK